MHDSHFTTNVDRSVNVVPSPKKSTLSFLRQFARTYASISGTAFSTMSVN